MKNIIILLVIAASLVACDKSLDPETPSFNVTLSQLSYKVGDTVNFQITGKANNISFYSGETGFAYENRERTVAEGVQQLQFTSYFRFLTQQNTMKLLATTDEKIIDSTSVVNANWIDLSDKATFSSGADDTPSGIIDISDLAKSGKPVTFAFKFTSVKGSVQPQWRIRSFDVQNVSNGQTIPTLNIGNASWFQVDVDNPKAVWSIGSNLFINGGGSAADRNLDYVVTRAVKLNSVFPDKALAIKDLSSSNILNYSHVYQTPGKYIVTFLAVNQTPDERKEVIKELEITVTP